MDLLKILLVDDENLIRERLRLVFPFEENGYKIVAEAANGEEALELCKTIDVDIVITDVVMPVMDGLELTKKLRKTMPHIKILLLSCHPEYEYVREALLCGASDYLLKTNSDFDTILNVLNNISKEISKENSFEKAHTQKTITTHSNTWDILTSNNLNLKDEADYILNTTSNNLIAFVITFKIIGYCYLCDTFSVQSIEDIKQNIIEYMQTFLLKKYDVNCFMSKSEYFGAILTMPQNVIMQSENDIEIHVNSIINNVKLTNHIICIAGCSELISTTSKKYCLENILKLYNQSKNCAEHYFYYPDKKSFFYSKLADKKFTPIIESISAKLLTELEAISSQPFNANAKSRLAKLCSTFSNLYIEPNSLKQLVFSCVEKRSNKEQITQSTLLNDFKHIESIHDINEFLSSYLIESDFSVFGTITTENTYVMRIIEYMQENYNNSITVEDLSAIFHLSPNYISHIFKKEIGINFVTCLTKIRINSACEMLKSTSLSMQDISFKVGINDSKYFIKIFKKIMDVTPNQYRNMHKA